MIGMLLEDDSELDELEEGVVPLLEDMGLEDAEATDAFAAIMKAVRPDVMASAQCTTAQRTIVVHFACGRGAACGMPRLLGLRCGCCRVARLACIVVRLA